MSWKLTFTVVLVATFTLAGPIGAETSQAQPTTAPTLGPAVCSLPPGMPAVPGLEAPAAVEAASCGFCKVDDFCPETAVRCTFSGTCTSGPGACCEYGCQCDTTCTTVTEPPSKACAFTTPECCACDTASFCARFGVRCTFNGDCTGGCCDYTCTCDGDCSAADPTPANACALSLPGNCCPEGRPFLCMVSYCANEGVRCNASGCGVNCCAYNDCQPDATCTAPDPLPQGAC